MPPAALEPDAADADAMTTSIFSGKDIRGYHIHALDGEIGHVDDFIIDEGTWSVRYLQIDTSNWIGGKTVLLATRWIQRIDPADGKIHVEVTKERIENSPEFDPDQPIDRAFEERLHQHYGLPAYWERERARTRAMGVSRRQRDVSVTLISAADENAATVRAIGSAVPLCAALTVHDPVAAIA